jgi:hypothetical protein
MSCVLPDESVCCTACAMRRKKCEWDGQSIVRVRGRKGVAQEVAATNRVRGELRRVARTESAPEASQKRARKEEEEEGREEGSKRMRETKKVTIQEPTPSMARVHKLLFCLSFVTNNQFFAPYFPSSKEPLNTVPPSPSIRLLGVQNQGRGRGRPSRRYGMMAATESAESKAKRARRLEFMEWMEGKDKDVDKARLIELRERLMKKRDQRAILNKEIKVLSGQIDKILDGKGPESSGGEESEEEE